MAALVLALGLVACGDSGDEAGPGRDATAAQEGTAAAGGTDEEQIKAVFGRFKDAFFAGDAEEACALLTERAQKQLAAVGKGAPDCVTRFTQMVAINRKGRPGDAKPHVDSVTVKGGEAVAILKAPGSRLTTKAPFVKEDGDWKIDGGFDIGI